MFFYCCLKKKVRSRHRDIGRRKDQRAPEPAKQVRQRPEHAQRLSAPKRLRRRATAMRRRRRNDGDDGHARRVPPRDDEILRAVTKSQALRRNLP